MVRIDTKIGSSIDYTHSVFKLVEKALMKHPEIDNYFSNIGGDLVNSGRIMLTLKSPKERKLTQQELMPILRKELKSIPCVEKAVIQDPSLMGLTAQRGFPVEFTLNGSDWDKLGALSNQFAAEMEKTGADG